MPMITTGTFMKDLDASESQVSSRHSQTHQVVTQNNSISLAQSLGSLREVLCIDTIIVCVLCHLCIKGHM